jgi:adenine phosphoribosyltransferase
MLGPFATAPLWLRGYWALAGASRLESAKSGPRGRWQKLLKALRDSNSDFRLAGRSADADATSRARALLRSFRSPRPEREQASMTTVDISKHLRDVPDFPKPGIVFKDITPLLANGPVFRQVCMDLADRYRDTDVTHIVSVESRGFIFGAAVAAELGLGFIPARKPGKLPHHSFAEEYALEYGTDTLEIHQDAFVYNDSKPKAVIIDDVLATGGTMAASINLVKQAGAQVAEAFCLIELGFLNGREKLGKTPFGAFLVLD